jgi:hypothetical protein
MSKSEYLDSLMELIASPETIEDTSDPFFNGYITAIRDVQNMLKSAGIGLAGDIEPEKDLDDVIGYIMDI